MVGHRSMMGVGLPLTNLGMSRLSVAMLSAVIVMAAPVVSVFGQLPRVKPERLGVDLVELRDGTKLYGFVLNRNADQSLNVAIERGWLQTTYPELAQEVTEQETEDRVNARNELLRRIDAWIAEREAEAQLVRYLRAERNYISSQLDADSQETSAEVATQFLLKRVAQEDQGQVRIASPANRRLAGLAFEEGVPNVTTTPASILKSKLEDAGIDLQKAKFDLSDDVPKLKQESPRAWSARRALVEYQMLKPLEFQGVGSSLFKTGEGAGNLQNPGDLLGLAQSMLGGSTLGGGGDSILSIGAELGLPEFKQFQKPKKPNEPGAAATNRSRKLDWAKKIIREAESNDIRGALVFRLDQNPLSDRVTVRTSFLVMHQPGDWFELVRLEHSVSAQAQTQEQIDALKQNPQLKETMATLESVLPGMQSQLDRALRHGAATEQAMSDAKEAFGTFIQQHTKSLLDNPIPVSE